MSLLDRQAAVSPQRGMPVEGRDNTTSPVAVASETVQFYYSNSGTRTADAGQAAGVAVEAVLQMHPVLNSSGVFQATKIDTSLSFTSTAFTTEKQFPGTYAEGWDAVAWADRLAAITSGFSNGDYCVDYAKGVLYGVKASTQTTLTATAYKVNRRDADSVNVTNTPAIISSATAIAANASRRGFSIQNLGTNALFVRLGDSASTSVFHYVLKAGSGADDGTGGSLTFTDGTIYTGIVTIAGTSPRYTTMEF